MKAVRVMLSGLGGLMVLCGALVGALGVSGLHATPLLVAGGGLAVIGLRWLSPDDEGEG